MFDTSTEEYSCKLLTCFSSILNKVRMRGQISIKHRETAFTNSRVVTRGKKAGNEKADRHIAFPFSFKRPIFGSEEHKYNTLKSVSISS
jgi:hypothetical protein